MSRLALEFCFRPGAASEIWQQALRVVWESSAAGIPLTVEQSGEGDDQPWSESSWRDIAEVCISDAVRTRYVLSDTASMRVAKREQEVKFSVKVESKAPSELLVRVLTALGSLSPELAMAFDPSSPDGTELLFQGRLRLDRIPPIFYLDQTALAAFGGGDSALARAVDGGAKLPTGNVRSVSSGLLFVVRENVWSKKTYEELEHERALQTLFGITARTPLSLAVQGEG